VSREPGSEHTQRQGRRQRRQHPLTRQGRQVGRGTDEQHDERSERPQVLTQVGTAGHVHGEEERKTDATGTGQAPQRAVGRLLIRPTTGEHQREDQSERRQHRERQRHAIRRGLGRDPQRLIEGRSGHAQQHQHTPPAPSGQPQQPQIQDHDVGEESHGLVAIARRQQRRREAADQTEQSDDQRGSTMGEHPTGGGDHSHGDEGGAEFDKLVEVEGGPEGGVQRPRSPPRPRRRPPPAAVWCAGTPNRRYRRRRRAGPGSPAPQAG
jgi:hypothetical protein